MFFFRLENFQSCNSILGCEFQNVLNEETKKKNETKTIQKRKIRQTKNESLKYFEESKSNQTH